MKRYKDKINNCVRKTIKIIKDNPQKTIKIIASILILIGIITGMNMLFKENKEQKYVSYDVKNLNEVRYQGYKELIDNLK